MKRIFFEFFIACIFIVLVQSDDDENLKKPLFLTSYIENGRIAEAKEKASVKHLQLKNTESYAGYLTINKTYNSNTFIWYFPSQNDRQNDPLVLWLNGGPGMTSLLGLFVENGPFIITENGSVEMRKYSWHINHNLIYIDNPVGAGYSFTENNLGYATTAEEVGRDLLIALIQFFKLFPELQSNDFYVTGESYAGKYVPSVSYAIKTYNKKAESKINLKGLAVGNAWIDPIKQMNDYSSALFDIGLIDLRERNQVEQLEGKIQELLRQEKYAETTLAFDELFFNFYTPGPSIFKKMTGFDFFYNYLQSEEPAEVTRYINWITKTDVREALHVGASTFNVSSRIVKDRFKNDLHRSIAHILVDLLQDYKVLIYCGQLDILCSCIGTEKAIAGFNWLGAEDYSRAKKKLWRVGNDIAGYSTVARNLNYVMVRNGGHCLPYDQPLWSWDMITRFTHHFNF